MTSRPRRRSPQSSAAAGPGAANDLHAHVCVVVIQLQAVQRLQSVDQRGTATGDDASSRAARVEDTASSMRCLRSFASTSVAAPTLMTPTPPAS